MESRYVAFGMFGIALAILCWRVSDVMNTRPLPTSIEPEDTPETPVAFLTANPSDVLGLSYLPGPPANDVLARFANVPNSRPVMTAPPRVAS